MSTLERATDAAQTLPRQNVLRRAWAAYPVHPPLTHLTIGAYTTASLVAVLGAAGVSERDLAKAWWLALLVGVCASVPTGASGLTDFLTMRCDHPARPAAKGHLILAVSTYPWFVGAVLLGHADYVRGIISTIPLALALVGFAATTAAGIAGGRLVFSKGIRVKRPNDSVAG